MKKFIKKFTTSLLIAAMLVSSLPAVSFAGGSSSDEPDRTAQKASYTNSGSTTGVSSKTGDGNTKDYILQVETGNVCNVSIKSIMITYCPTGSTEHVTQVLSPEYVEGGSFSGVLGDNGKYLSTGNMWANLGTKEITYKSVLGNNEKSSANYTYKTSDGTVVTPNINSYLSWAKTLVSDLSTDYTTASDKSSELIHSNDTEFYRFRTDLAIGELYSLTFVIYPPEGGNQSSILNTNSDDWMLASWSLYELDSSSLRAVNYAFVSDRVGLDFAGTCLYKSTSVTEAKLAENGVGGTEARPITFFNKASLPATLTEDGLTYTFSDTLEEYVTKNSKGSTVEIGDAGDIYRCDYFDGDKATFCFEAKNTQRTVGSTSKIYNFAINIADVYGAGIEQFNKSPNWTEGVSFDINEMLTATIEYTTNGGGRQTVTLPVIANSLLEFGIDETESKNTNYTRILEGGVESFAQQGEAICFSVTFPDIKTLNNIEITFKNPNDSSDFFVIQNIAVYDNWGYTDYPRRSMYTDRSNGASIDMYPDTAKLVFYAPDVDDPVWLDIANPTESFEFKDVRNEANPTLPDENDYENAYLITCTTDDVKGVGTQAEVFMQLEYEDTSGKTKTTAEYSLMEECADFCGYIYGEGEKLTAQHDKATAEYIYDDKGNIKYDTEETTLDASYYYYMSALSVGQNTYKGNSVSFILNIKNVSKFTGAYFRIDEDTEDAWQMGEFKIEKLNTGSAIGRRQIDLGGAGILESENDSEIKYSIKIGHGYTRQVTGTQTVVQVKDAGVYLNHGGEKFLDFVNNNDVTGDDEKKKNYEEYMESMEYSDAVSDLKLDEVTKNYEIRVHVASNSSTTSNSDNCGSGNLYYFQLVFNTGTSGYVLANQQLEADAFRSGQTECFNIAINDDYGDVVALNIIPDDVSSNAEPLDKLCIDYIEIIKINTNTANKIFTISNVGWIVADYTDTSTSTSRATRSEYELAHTFNEITIGYALDLEFAFSIDAYPEDADQFEGDLTMDFYYKDSNGNKKSIKSIQVVEKLYEYNDLSPKYDKDKNIISDTTKMFRAGTVDRFLVTVTDCCVLERIVIKGLPYEDNGFLKIKDVTVRALRDKGTLKMINSGDYKQLYDEQGEPLLDDDGNPTYEFVGTGEAEMTRVYKTGMEPIEVGTLKKKPQSAYQFTHSGSLKYQLYFSSESQIPELDEDTTLSSLASRTPQSSNDTLNLYVYLKEGVLDPVKGNYKLTTDISYESVQDQGKQLHTSATGYSVEYDNGQTVLVRMGLNANNLSVISNVSLTCSKISDNSLEVDHIIIQQVRAGVIIDTYKVRFASTIFGREGGCSMWDIVSAGDGGYKQIVTLQLGPETPDAELAAEENDIAVSITYKAGVVTTSQETYTSQKVYATDCGTESIHKGQMLSFEFNEANVSEILSITVNGIGDVTGQFNGANIKCYSPDSAGEPALSGWFSIDAPDDDTEVQIGPTAFTATVAAKTQDSLKALKKVDFTFLTTEVSAMRDSSGTVPIRAKILYKQTNGGSGQLEIADIRDYVTEGNGFAPGAETTISFFLPGLKSLRSIELEPYDEDETTSVTWNLDTIKYVAEGIEDETLHTMPVKDTIHENNSSLLNLSTIYLDLTVENQGIIYETVNGSVDISAEEGVTLTFTPVIYESTAGYKVIVYKVVGGGLEQIKSYGSDIDSFNYKVTNSTNENLTYRFVVESNENPAVTATVNVTVPVAYDNGSSTEDIVTTGSAITTGGAVTTP